MKSKSIFTYCCFIIGSWIWLQACQSPTEKNPHPRSRQVSAVGESSDYMRGLSFVGTPEPCTEADFDSVLAIGANYISLMPFAFVDSKKAILTYKDIQWQWWGESVAGIETCIQMAKVRNITSMIKPQLWIDDGMFTGIFDLRTEEEWQQVETNYSAYILRFAELSEKYTLPVFCIATELDTWAVKRPHYWKSLIARVRQIYKGKLVYACNWDAYKRIPFWSELDFIGVDAYFPLSDEAIPTQIVLSEEWNKINIEFNQLSDSVHKKILFTEWGYQAREYTTRDPWIENNDIPLSEEAQAVCYDALLANCSKQSWWAGGFVWKWFPHSGKEPSQHHERFSPQNRKARFVLEKYFKSQSGLEPN